MPIRTVQDSRRDTFFLSINSSISGLKFFFNTTLDRPELVRKMRYLHEPRKIPEILSVEEVSRIIQSAGGLKYQAALSVSND